MHRNKRRDTQCDKSLRHVTGTGCCNKSPRVACENHCRYDRILSLRYVDRSDKISASSLVAACVRICEKSLRQNLNQPMSERQLVSRHVKFELVYISSLPKIHCVHQTSVLSQRLVAALVRTRCVAAICRIVCLGLNIILGGMSLFVKHAS